MTDKQKQKIKDKIKKIKQALAAEKRKLGGYDDGSGLRYAPTGLYVILGDFDGGLKYLKWFNINFPTDIGVPAFLFESAIIYFNKGMIKEAEDYALKTYFSNKFVIDQYFGRTNFFKDFDYRHDDDDYLEFSEWLKRFNLSERFVLTIEEFDEIEQQLQTEPVGPKRNKLVERLYRLV